MIENINLFISITDVEELMNSPFGMMQLMNKGTITNEDKIRVELKKVGDHWEIDK